MLHLARRASIPVIAVAVVALLAACTPLNSQEQYMLGKTNDLRTASGLGRVYEYEPLTAKARTWAAYLAAQGQLSHEDLHALGVGWSEAAENVGRAGSIEQVEDLWEASAGHRANILNGDYLLAGFGTARGKDGSVYAVELFIKS